MRNEVMVKQEAFAEFKQKKLDLYRKKISAVFFLLTSFAITANYHIDQQLANEMDDVIFILRLILTVIGVISYFLYVRKIISYEKALFLFLIPSYLVFSYIPAAVELTYIEWAYLSLSLGTLLFIWPAVINIWHGKYMTMLCLSYFSFLLIFNSYFRVTFGDWLCQGGIRIILATIASVLITQYKYSKFLNSIENEYMYIVTNREVQLLNKKLELKIMDLEKKSNIDVLTKAYNRRYFVEQSKRYLNEFNRNQSDVSVIFMDIDNFKFINDSYGHDFGDRVLIMFSNIVKQQIRESDTFARWGGEEFVVFFPDTDLNTSIDIAERIRKTVKDYEFIFENNKVTVTVTIGVVHCIDECDISKIILKADKLMYHGKTNGKDIVVSDLIVSGMERSN